MNVSTEGLPPEMQQRIADIIEKAKANAVQSSPEQQAPQQAPLAARPPSLMDHIIALRQEVAALRQELHASAQVTEAVGQAVGSLYQMFHQQTEPTNYSSQFETAQPSQVDDF